MLPQMVGSVATNIGGNTKTSHVGHDFSPGFMISGYDQPAISYSPLTGAALVQQIAQPITVDSIAALYDSDWSILTVLTFVTDRISIRPTERFDVIDAISRLHVMGVLTMVAVKSPATGGGGPNDSLVLFCDPDRAASEKLKNKARDDWATLKKIYAESYIDPLTIGPAPAKPAKAPANPGKPWEYSIELRTAPATQAALPAPEVIPLLRLRSAYGMLKNCTDDTLQWITFLTPGTYDKLWKRKEDRLFFSYIPFSLKEKIDAEELSEGEKDADLLEADRRAELAKAHSHFGPGPTAGTGSAEERSSADSSETAKDYVWSENGIVPRPHSGKNPEEVEDRHFMAIVKSNSPQPNAYVSVCYHGSCYYIDKRDLVSQRNFELITQLLNLQSVVPPSPPPTPTISVGGH